MPEPAPSSQPVGSNYADREDWLRLAFVGLTAERCRVLVERWQTPRAALDAARGRGVDELLATSSVTPTTVERLREAGAKDLGPVTRAMDTFGIRLLLQSDSDYPNALRNIPGPPPYLFVRGTVEPRDEVAVAIVGTRGASDYGRGVAEKLAIDLAVRGVTVVSGLARGIDSAAHRGALEAGGRTFAVCGCGLDIVYPSDNKGLMEQVQYSGAAFSEYAPTVHPESWHFPQRNRIISGLSAGVIIVEAGEKSGALITADYASEQGRDVFAVPGNIHRLQSRGAHALIKQGATLIESADDVLEALNNRALPFDKAFGANAAAALDQRTSTPKVDLNESENRVWLATEVEPKHIDDIATAAGMGAAAVNSTLVLLELKGVVRRLPGSLFIRT